MNQAQFLRRIAEATMDASIDELRVIATLAERIANGRKTYGPLRVAEDRRAWSREMCEEFLDAAVYSAISIVANETGERETLPPPRSEQTTLMEDDRAVPVDRLSAGTTSAPDWTVE